MLRCGKSIRLTRKEIERLEHVTALPIGEVRTLEDFKRYVARCKAYHFENSKEYALLAMRIDHEVSRCLVGRGGLPPNVEVSNFTKFAQGLLRV